MLSSHTYFSEKHFYSQLLYFEMCVSRLECLCLFLFWSVILHIRPTSLSIFIVQLLFMLLVLKLATSVNVVQSEWGAGGGRNNDIQYFGLQYLFRPLVVILTDCTFNYSKHTVPLSRCNIVNVLYFANEF